MMNHSAWLRAVAVAAFSLCLGVVVLGAYVRLSDAGLGCPDWPGCYGHLTPAGAAADARTASAPMAGRPLEIGKAWREMVHRYAAGTLGVLIVCLTAMGIAWRRERIVPAWFVIALLAIVLLQGTLGMLTVTWQLKPLIVSLHLLFGFTTLSLLWWLVLTLRRTHRDPGRAASAVRAITGAVPTHALAGARRLALLGLIAVSCRSHSVAGPAATTPPPPARTCRPARAAGGRRPIFAPLSCHGRARAPTRGSTTRAACWTIRRA